MYFKNFPNILYEFKIAGKDTITVVKDITRNIRFRRDVLANVTVFDEYDIVDSETPEHIAEKVYGNPEYHWIVMLANERYHHINDFPLSTRDLETYINATYTQPYATHHYENSAGFVVNSSEVGAYAVSNYDYEVSRNEAKRRIKLIPPIYVAKILSEYKEIL